MTLPRRKFLQSRQPPLQTLPMTPRLAWAQDYPARPVRMIVPNTPGGPPDTFARLIAPKLSERLHRQFVVENIPGAGGNIGTGTGSAVTGRTVTRCSSAVKQLHNQSRALCQSVPYDAAQGLRARSR